MSRRIINVGSAPLAGDGESIRDALIKTNDNFEEVYSNIESIVIPDVSNFITADDIPFIPTDVSDLTDTEGLLGQGGTNSPIQPYLELTNNPFIIQPVILGEPIEFIRTAEGLETDAIDEGLTLARGSNGALYNSAAEIAYDRDNNTSPAGTEWNSEGWGDLLNLQTRTYSTLYSALNNRVGNNIIDVELVMHDTINDKYYKFDFSDWGQNNGGSFAYTRTLVEDPNFFEKKDYATANNVDVIEDDSTLQIGITRDNNNGIYNPFTEQGWNSDVSPEGTLWNVDGWDDLTTVETRSYTNFYAAYGNGGLGNKVPGSKAVMYVPSIDKYYAIQWLNWTQNNVGGGFSYLIYELDLTKLNEGVKFPDGTILKSADGLGRVKSTASGGRRIEEAVGSKTVSVTGVTTNTITATASRSVVNDNRFWVSRTATNIATIIDNPNAAGVQDYSTIQFSLDNLTWYTYTSGYTSTDTEIGVDCFGGPFTYNEGDTIYFRYGTGGGSVIWWDKADLPGGSADFRGAIIDYHAYTGEATWIGTIYIADDTGNEHITHIETSSGSSDSENDNLWIVTNEGQIKYRRIDGEAKTLKVHWTAKVFYGSEIYD